MKAFISLLILMVLAAVSVGLYSTHYTRGEQVHFRTAPVIRGDLIVTVEATGTLEPEELVDVGAQVVGRIKEFGLDPRGETDPKFKNKRIDYGSTVREGTVLALIDEAVYLAQRDQAKAALERAVADLAQLDAKLGQTEAEWKRAQRLRSLSLERPRAANVSLATGPAVEIRGISDADYVLAKANYEVALANIEVGKAVVQQQQSALDLAETNLSYTIIQSPVDGTIIDRRVNVGQTVVSSMNAPSLFLIAKDLRRMQIWASVNEADIGVLKVGTPVTFSVDAFPDDTFTGVVEQVRLNATMTQNVVTYTVVVATENPDLKLLPYLTAQVNFEIDRRDQVLKIPSTALSYAPREELIDPEAEMSAVPDGKQTVWARRGDYVYPITVTTGVTDGSQTEVHGADLDEGLEIVLAELEQQETEQVNNPFTPKIPRRGGPR